MAKILEVSQVTPFTDNSPEYSFVPEFSLPTTFFDSIWLKFTPVERLFFYSLVEPNESLSESVVPKLKRTLSLTLRHFLPLAGTLTWPHDSPQPVILYRAPNDAVSLTIAESNADFNLLCSDKPREASSFDDLVPKLEVSGSRASVISLQVTLFPHKGFSIGVTSHHAVLDGKSTTMFVKSWAHFCRDIDSPPPLSLPSELAPSFDRSVIKDPKGLNMLYLKQWSAFSGSKIPNPRDDPKLFEHFTVLSARSEIVRATFNLSSADIAKLRQDILCSCSLQKSKEPLKLSSFVVVYTYVLLCMLKATKESGDKIFYAFAADYRSRMRPPVPENYFGNCVGSHACLDDAREMIAESDSEALAEMATRVVGLMRNKMDREDVMEGADEWLAGLGTIGQGRAIGVAGSPRFGDYGVDFGWGRPRKVEIVSTSRTGAVSMAESRDGSGGVEVGVVLKMHEMKCFTSMFVEGLKSQ